MKGHQNVPWKRDPVILEGLFIERAVRQKSGSCVM